MSASSAVTDVTSVSVCEADEPGEGDHVSGIVAVPTVPSSLWCVHEPPLPVVATGISAGSGGSVVSVESIVTCVGGTL